MFSLHKFAIYNHKYKRWGEFLLPAPEIQTGGEEEVSNRGTIQLHKITKPQLLNLLFLFFSLLISLACGMWSHLQLSSCLESWLSLHFAFQCYRDLPVYLGSSKSWRCLALWQLNFCVRRYNPLTSEVEKLPDYVQKQLAKMYFISICSELNLYTLFVLINSFYSTSK